MKIAVALGGGGARGLTHIGVLKVLEENKIKISCISGTSIGALIGAMYAVGKNPKIIGKEIKNYLFNVLFSKEGLHKINGNDKKFSTISLIRQVKYFVRYGSQDKDANSFVSESLLDKMVKTLLPNIDVSQTKIPFACVATDITNGGEKIFTKGNLQKIVLASASIPGVFPPVNIDNAWYTDGAHVNVTPVNVAKFLGADFVIASDVKSKLKSLDYLPSNSKDLMNRCNFIANHLFYKMLIKEADVVIEPNIKHISWSEFNKLNLIVNEGIKETKLHMNEIIKKISKHNSITNRLKLTLIKIFNSKFI